MGNWAQKKEKLEHRIERNSCLCMTACAMSAICMVGLLIVGIRYADAKDKENTYKQVQEMCTQPQKQK